MEVRLSKEDIAGTNCGTLELQEHFELVCAGCENEVNAVHHV